MNVISITHHADSCTKIDVLQLN